MTTSNHSEKGTSRRTSRIYNLTPAGSRLANYLLYLDSRPWRQDFANPDVPGPEAPPEQYDLDHQDLPQPRPNPRKTPHPDQPEYQDDGDEYGDDEPLNPGFEDDWDLDDDDYGDHSPEED